MKIVTLTLNPAFDMHCYSKDFRPYHENVATVTDYNAGGKGINISRALLSTDIQNRAVVIVGKENGAGYLEALKRDGVDVDAIMTEGRIRENITLHAPGVHETRISFRGFTADEGLLRVVTERLHDLGKDDILTLTGSNPEGIGIEAVKCMLSHMKSRGIRVVVDSNSFTLEDLLEIKPWLIKPNGEEIGRYAGGEPDTIEKTIKAARKMHKSGIENAMISLGANGAVLACEEGTYHAFPPERQVVSTIGAGDSSIAGFMKAFMAGAAKSECLRSAVAFGSAACLTTGTNPPQRKDIERLLHEVTLKEK